MSETGDRRREQGAIPLEAALLAPVLLMMLLFGVAAGRTETSHGFLNAAARAAARAASLSRTPTSAQTNGQAAAQSILKAQGVPCTPYTHVDTSQIGKRPGTPGYVTVVIHCRLSLKDLTLVPGLPGSIPVDATFVSTIDTYRAKH
ncbi:Flp pilus assembly protein TadG [Streptacidiphilus sp. MAP12-20]|uniref:TadE/TadG family type IV pilus assembly protein n=1 Tax=Streptacidiphilus sp. MAP12-20 TaxID=3156299 RepID=UPI003512D401